MHNVLQTTISGAVNGAKKGAIAGAVIDSFCGLAVLDTISSRLMSNDVSREFREVMPFMLLGVVTSPFVGALLGGTVGAFVGAGKGLYQSMAQDSKAAQGGPNKTNTMLPR